MRKEGRQPEGLTPRGPFDHPKLRDIIRKEVDVAPGWDETEPDRPEADRVEELPPREALDVPRESLVERALKRSREY